MNALRSTATTVLRDLLATQPNTPEKMRFAWRIAAGPAMARAASVDWSIEKGLRVRPQSESWRREILRARPVLTARLGQLVGDDIAKRLIIANALHPDRQRRHERGPNEE